VVTHRATLTDQTLAGSAENAWPKDFSSNLLEVIRTERDPSRLGG
jgi:hypothetical protein